MVIKAAVSLVAIASEVAMVYSDELVSAMMVVTVNVIADVGLRNYSGCSNIGDGGFRNSCSHS